MGTTIAELIDAQGRTEERLEELIIGLNALRVEIGRLSDTIEFRHEDITRTVLPSWLYRHLKVEIDKLRREFITINRREDEINLYG